MEQGYWFPAKRYGWGWGFPVTWQGWATFALWFAAMLVAALRLMPQSPGLFLAAAAAATIVLAIVCYLKGEPPGWRRGNKV